MAIQPFQIDVPPATLDDLNKRLAMTRRGLVVARGGWDYGTDPDYLAELLHYWRVSFDWRAREAHLNRFAQFKADVDGAQLHFIHERTRSARSIPLLLLHGWPDSFVRYLEVVPLLRESDALGSDLGFDAIVPSLPGFAFTGFVSKPAETPRMRHTARLLWSLMTNVLGYERFGVCGGDGGSVLAQVLAIEYPEHVIGIHLTDLGWHATSVPDGELSVAEKKYIKASTDRFRKDGAYAAVQAKQPLTLAAGLNNSPAGLASWIVDRFHSWAGAPDRFEKSFGKDELLTNIMLYWTTRTIGSSILGYWEETRQPSLTPHDRVECPVGLALFPADLGGVPPRGFAERTLNVQRYEEMPRGGHFGAMEEPELFASDVEHFFASLAPTRADVLEKAAHERPAL